MDNRRKWVAVLIQEAFRLRVIEAEDLLRHVTPSVLATDLPPNLVATLLENGLKTQTFTAEGVVETLGVDRLAEHVPLSLLWTCIEEAASIILQKTSTGAAASELEILGPGEVRPEDVPVIEVLED